MSGWEKLPVDEHGYVPAAELLKLPANELKEITDGMLWDRYTGWRNDGNKWRKIMGLDELAGKRILDFGCGVGVEAAQLADSNIVTVADIFPVNTELARRVCTLYGVTADEMIVSAEPPVFPDWVPPASFDVFYASGSLHHSRFPVETMTEVHRLLRPGGQCRLMLYSDRGWRIANNGARPPHEDTHDTDRDRFVRFFDAVGDWADWWSEWKLIRKFGDMFSVERFSYLTPDDRYCAAVLRRKDS